MKLYSIPDIRLFWSDDPGFLVQFSVADCHTPITYKVITSDTTLHHHNPSLSQPSIATTLHRHSPPSPQPFIVTTLHCHNPPSSQLLAVTTFTVMTLCHQNLPQSQLSVTVTALRHSHKSMSLSQLSVTVTNLCHSHNPLLLRVSVIATSVCLSRTSLS